MKKILTIFLIIGTYLIFSSSITKAPSPCDSPFVGDHSGAPGETNCSGCHISPVNPDVPDLYFALDSNQLNYIPGKSYLVHLRIRRVGHDKFGFVCTSLDSLNKAKGTFDLIDSINTRKFNSGNRTYISHTPCGADSQDSIYWDFRWKAPVSNSGTIKIYMSSLVANHNHALTGDTTYTRILTLKPSVPTNSINSDNFEFVKVYPTLFNDLLIIKFDDQFQSKEKQISITDFTGRVLETFSTMDQNISHFFLDCQISGIYFLQIKTKGFLQTYKLIKQ
ncbi:MAG: T9SS type A sorting domain-containing protein [Saprospiraceae bacterium]|nr:T9SS type A sorting domain-containing protein [Saprospiraceae bacterium]MBK8298724.1 T9SS type A sorting domain-containing protein [Saprospiraceae bacterium]